MTDAMRGQLLEMKGYKTQLLEFIDMEHTPKNILIRGVKSKGLLPKAARKQQMENYQKCRDFFGAELTLEKLFKEMEGRWRMSRTKKILLTLLAYLTAFIAAVCVSSFVLNQGKSAVSSSVSARICRFCHVVVPAVNS